MTLRAVLWFLFKIQFVTRIFFNHFYKLLNLNKLVLLFYQIGLSIDLQNRSFHGFLFLLLFEANLERFKFIWNKMAFSGRKVQMITPYSVSNKEFSKSISFDDSDNLYKKFYETSVKTEDITFYFQGFQAFQ